MSFAADDIATEEVRNVGTYCDDAADEFVANGHRDWNSLLRPLVPFVNMDIGAADARAQDADEYIVDADGGEIGVFEPQPRFAAAF